MISKLVAVFPGSANVKFDKKVKKADLSWTNIKGVKEYVVYFNKAKSGTKWVKYKTTKKNKMTIKGLGKGKLKKKSKDYEFGVQVIVDTPEGIKKSKIVKCY